MTADAHHQRFTELRPLLFTIVYEILGSGTDTDDVLQDSYLRWAAVDPGTVRDPRSYLAVLVTRQALNARRESARRREDYVGPWLPEPLLVDEHDVAEDVVLAESVSMAMMIVLETLEPAQRAVFVLHDVFGFAHREVAQAIGRTESATRQIAHRARGHVHARRPRRRASSTAEAARVVDQFLAAAATGDTDALMATLAPGVVWTADGGGKATAARRPIVGAATISTVVLSLFRRLERSLELRVSSTHCNGAPALLVHRGEQLDSVFLLEVVDDVIVHVYAVRNPDKLATTEIPRRIGRSEGPG